MNWGRGSGSPGGRPREDCSKYRGSFSRGEPNVFLLKEALGNCSGAIKKELKERFESALRELENGKGFFGQTPEKRLEWAIWVSAYLVALNLKTNQVRKVLELARNIELDFKNYSAKEEDTKAKLARMRFLMAYAVGKAEKQKEREPLEAIHRVLDPLLKELMENPDRKLYKIFYDFVQAVIAYHRFFGGSDK
ncbi:hypothetical protein APY94_04220 [Thermococcus celericrescens]|uniref:CRISPR system Cms protein Csm2 n=1 Tax=Thermococcus celericrescens TaxID=227598 RepID=A0A117ITH0_9EURY|nr:type III-A CRISPR-associated protein Csm2 [Thermococcus celericrescens]KUH33942.1 hypothetical protein APY94_04220 [Thermococcus celericrescens]